MQSFLQHRRLKRCQEEQVKKENIAFRRSSASLEKIEDESENQQSPPSTSQIKRADNGVPDNAFTDHLVRETLGISITKYDQNGIPESFVVENGIAEDKTDPRSWTRTQRAGATVIIWLMVFVCGYASAASSSSRPKASAAFHVSKEVEGLATALFLFGNSAGALLSGPLSETTGRNPAYLMSMALYLICVLITALSPNAAVMLVFRFFSGLFASPTLTIYGGSLADMFSDTERSLVWPIFATAPLLGPILAPVPSGWIEYSYLSFRWIDWVILIISGAVFLLAVFFLQETLSPMLLTWKASILRQLTGDPRFRSSHELAEPLMARMGTNIKRPLIFFTREPIVVALGSYLTLIYVLVFTFLDGFTFLFENTYGFNSGQKGSVFASIAIGVLINMSLQPLFAKHYVRKLRAHRDETDDPDAKLAPEIRLWPAIFCSPLLPISLFWLGWTNWANVNVWNGIVAAGLFGLSLFGIFVSSYQYIMDAYETQSSSALSSITFMRYAVAGGMVIADMPMYNTLGVHWTLTLLGCLGIALMPLPAVFWWYGSKIRQKSHFLKSMEEENY